MAFRTGTILFPPESSDESALYRLEVRDVSIRNDVAPEREVIRRKRRDLSDENVNVETAFAVAKRVLLRMEEKVDGKWSEVSKPRWDSVMNEYERVSEVIMEKALALREEKNAVVKQNALD